jgi:tetratricopeptide (TPR) repeat protein
MAWIKPFRAFVSYCHADRVFAARLQRRLEVYRLPRRLADRVVPLPGQVSGRIGPIFRDREDLSAAADLSQAVRDAIAASSALVVVASPDAARSHWVAREIELFRELHPAAPVLVAHARGNPGEALPEMLRGDGVEPLAADFRREGDGGRLAFLKIVAGLVGLPLDTLVQRDAQRRLRRVTAVTLGSGILVAVMAVMLVVTLLASADARQRRADAEGFVRFMHTTLRKDLQSVGRLKIMEGVNARALAYFDEQGDPRNLPDNSILLRAVVLHGIGEGDIDRGDYLGAEQRLREAERSTAAVLARRPDDADAIFTHAQSEYWVGQAREKQNDLSSATQYYQRYDALAQRLIAIDPADPKYMMEAGFGQQNLGNIEALKRVGDFGRKRVTAALGWFEKAARLHPDDRDIRGEIANSYAWLADSDYLAGDSLGALAKRQRELAERTRVVAADHADNNARFRLARAQFAVSKMLIVLGRWGEARPLLLIAEGTVGALAAFDPENESWSSILGRIRNTLKKGNK